MQMLYDSDTFVVVHNDANAPGSGGLANLPARHGFEIVDKRSNMEVYLDGTMAAAFQSRIKGWQDKMPTQEEVEQILEGYTELAQYPLVMH